MSNDLTNTKIQNTYRRVVTRGNDSLIYDGTGSLFTPPTASYALFAVSSSHEVTLELSSSYAQSSSFADSVILTSIYGGEF